MRIKVEIETVHIENDNGREIEGIRATCTRCEHSTESFGTGPGSVRRCLALMREECPNAERNFYAAED
jgi:hypothetical protein